MGDYVKKYGDCPKCGKPVWMRAQRVYNGMRIKAFGLCPQCGIVIKTRKNEDAVIYYLSTTR